MEQNGIQGMKEEEDRISLLPDSLLIDIISRLPVTIEAIRTCILSKRWQLIWTQLPNLTFVDNDYKRVHFSLDVDKTLAQCSSQINLNSFRLYTTAFLDSKVNDWIHYAINRNVQELELSFWLAIFAFEPDQFFFTNSCFTHLKLKRCSLNPTGAISWNKLKSLYIDDAQLDEDLIQNILLGSPMLETLELNSCCGPFSRIDITSKSVKKLVFCTSPGFFCESCNMEINAPHIQSLTIKTYVRLGKFLLHDVSSLVKAKLYYKEMYCKTTDEEDAEDDMLKGILLSLRHVKELKIGKQCSKVLSRLEAKGFVFPPGLRLPDDSNSRKID